MEESVKKLYQERMDNEKALYTGKMPSRVPIRVNVMMDVVAQYAGFDLKTMPAYCAPVLDPANYTHSQVGKVESKYLVSWEDYKKEHPFAPDNAKARIDACAVNTMKAICGFLR